MRGYGLITQPSPYDAGEEPWLNNPDLQRLYDRYRHVILGRHQRQKVRHTFNFPTRPNVTAADLQNFLRQVEGFMSTTFRFNVALGVILRSRQTGMFRYHFPDDNVTLLRAPIPVYNGESLQRALDELGTLDLDGAASLDRPDTEWEVYMICHVTFYVYDTGYILAGDRSESDESESDESESDDFFGDKAVEVSSKRRCIQSSRPDKKPWRKGGDNLCFFR